MDFFKSHFHIWYTHYKYLGWALKNGHSTPTGTSLCNITVSSLKSFFIYCNRLTFALFYNSIPLLDTLQRSIWLVFLVWQHTTELFLEMFFSWVPCPPYSSWIYISLVLLLRMSRVATSKILPKSSCVISTASPNPLVSCPVKENIVIAWCNLFWQVRYLSDICLLFTR